MMTGGTPIYGNLHMGVFINGAYLCSSSIFFWTFHGKPSILGTPMTMETSTSSTGRLILGFPTSSSPVPSYSRSLRGTLDSLWITLWIIEFLGGKLKGRPREAWGLAEHGRRQDFRLLSSSSWGLPLYRWMVFVMGTSPSTNGWWFRCSPFFQTFHIWFQRDVWFLTTGNGWSLRTKAFQPQVVSTIFGSVKIGTSGAFWKTRACSEVI